MRSDWRLQQPFLVHTVRSAALPREGGLGTSRVATREAKVSSIERRTSQSPKKRSVRRGSTLSDRSTAVTPRACVCV
jgi:hypothetical protein